MRFAVPQCLTVAVAILEGLIGYTLGFVGTRKIENMQMTKLTEYLHTAAAAQFLGVSQNTIRKWAARGEISMHRNPANGYRLFKRSDLEKFLRQIERPVTAVKPL